MKHKLAVVVGHNSVSQGAVRSDTGETEFSYNSRLASLMENYAQQVFCNEMEVKTFFRTPGGGYSAEIARVYAETDRWGADATIELHFNSVGNPNVSGTETFTSGSRNSIILAQEVQAAMLEDLGLNDRGVKVRNGRVKGRGWRSLVSGRAPAILIEPFFGSSHRGQQATDTLSEQQSLAEVIIEASYEAMEQFE